MPEIARPWKSKQVVGPHVVEPKHSPVHLHDRIRDLHGKFTYQWVCKYCDESDVTIEGLAHVPSDCNGVEWLESEREAING